MMPRCRRCGDRYEPTTRRQERCAPCEREVNELIRTDEDRRNRGIAVKDFTGTTAL